ncbi:hypothetical protein PENANT_c015G00303 [Penicillium antarcticum]|uniref:Uncharacterized protein n=1 Tax=Penicillium antarcticum TaxID=416450 RepID=A0A1V6Q3C8_9EURO|nr:uncharacterized protein N7508_004874 [Penicillium antarcticum]KAJ5305859.1 hypothetical protein N7508_004874 [Penicillium antarcticum]OQD83763.1 hypothetical protein PENANT_c015G00303 [Penicillium antarcticum]
MSTTTDQELSYELVSKGKPQTYCITRPGSQENSAYYIETHETFSKHKFDLILHQGHSKVEEVLGVAKMHRRGFTIGVGNPAGEIEGNEMIWERLERPEKYSHKVYYFDFGTGATRTTYTWRKSYRSLGRLKTMELRVGGVDEENGRLLATWIGSNTWKMKDGSLFIASTVNAGQDPDSPGDEETTKWELMVCLTTIAIIESQVRRSKG